MEPSEDFFRDHTQEIARALFPSGGPTPGTHVLELGCGPGFYACRLSREYPQIHTTGVDLSRRLIARAPSRAASRSLQNCTFAHGDAHALDDPANSIDAIVVSASSSLFETAKPSSTRSSAFCAPAADVLSPNPPLASAPESRLAACGCSPS